MQRTQFWTDGCCLRNPGGPGGWAFVVERAGHELHTASGYAAATTNNRMELMAAIEALRWIEPGWVGDFSVVSDSKYLVNGASSWMHGWKGRNWRKRGLGGALIPNADLWQEVYELLQDRHGDVKVKFRWVKGHNGHRFNEAADKLASEAARDLPADPAEEFVERFLGPSDPIPVVRSDRRQ